MRRQIIVGALFLAVIIVLIRTILGTPFIKRIAESFQSGGNTGTSAINTMTICPAGSQMYMYEGRAYCCNGTINADADDVSRTCRASLFTPGLLTTFCTLGPAHKGVKNCLELRAGLLQAEGETRCPPSQPNFCQGNADTPTAAGRCCAGVTNEMITDCNSSADKYCDMAPAGSNPLQSQWKSSCDFQRLAELDKQSCPQGYNQTIIDGQGAFAGLTIYGCSNMTQTCYSQDLIGRLRKMGIDTGSLPPCTVGQS
jgi:hypothetical protein